MEKVHIGVIGILAGFLTTLSFMPQVVKIIRTKHVRDISLYMYIILTLGILLWLIYGAMIGEMPIIIANSVTLLLSLAVVFMKIRYGRGPKR